MARAHARLGLAVVAGLLLDLLATGDRAGVDAALEVFARRYAGAWWELQAGTGTSDARLVAAAVPRAHVNATGVPTSMRRLPSAIAVAWKP